MHSKSHRFSIKTGTATNCASRKKFKLVEKLQQCNPFYATANAAVTIGSPLPNRITTVSEAPKWRGSGSRHKDSSSLRGDDCDGDSSDEDTRPPSSTNTSCVGVGVEDINNGGATGGYAQIKACSKKKFQVNGGCFGYRQQYYYYYYYQSINNTFNHFRTNHQSSEHRYPLRFSKRGKRRSDKQQQSVLDSVNEQSDQCAADNRRASVPDSKRSMTDTEQQYDSEAENSIFNVAMPPFVSSHFKMGSKGNIPGSTENFKNRQGSTGNLMRKPFTAIRVPSTGTTATGPPAAYSENEMTDSVRSVKKSISSDNFQNGGVNNSGLFSGGVLAVKHKIGQGLAHSSLIVSAPPSKSSRKQSKANPTPDTMVFLFEAVEVCNLDKVCDLLNTGVRDINAPNEDDFTILDMAILLNFDVMATQLLKHGARENPKFMAKEMRIQHVNHLLKRCDAQIHVLLPALVTAAQGSSGSNNSANTNSSQRAAKETELRFWEWRQRLLTKMKACFELARSPEPPTKVEVSVISSTSIKVVFTPPKSNNGSIVTRYKISWSRSSSFETVEGEHVLLDLRDLQFVIRGLTHAVEIFVRVSAANIKGFGPHQISTPESATPSNWRDICNKERRCSGKKVTELSLLYEQIKSSSSSSQFSAQSSGAAGASSQLDSSSPAKRNNIIKHLLPLHPKFVKSLNKGVYLSCALYTPDDKVVVTGDDVIPTVEVDEGTPANISQDFHWFLKLSVVWDDLSTICKNLTLNSSNTSICFRAKLIQAVFSLQTLLSWRDVGKVYHRVLRDNHGNMIFVLIGHLPDNKCPAGSAVKLSPLVKVVNKRKPKLDASAYTAQNQPNSNFESNQMNNGSGAPMHALPSNTGSFNNNNNSSSIGASLSSSFLDDFSALDMLFLDLEELIRFHQNQHSSLKSGLYLTLIKAESSISTLNVQVPYNCPNMTTCVKVRDNCHVSKEEWIWIHNLHGGQNCGLTTTQANFRRSLAIAAGKLFKKLSIKDDNGYRIYKDEIIEVNSDVSVIIMLPPEVTTVNKHSDLMGAQQSTTTSSSAAAASTNVHSVATSQLVPLTVQLFEFTHLMVYQHYITSAYCRLCCLLDTMNLVASYQLREAFTDEEIKGAKKRLEVLTEAVEKSETIWHSMRWLLDILQQNRMSRNKLGVHLKALLDTPAASSFNQTAVNKAACAPTHAANLEHFKEKQNEANLPVNITNSNCNLLSHKQYINTLSSSSNITANNNLNGGGGIQQFEDSKSAAAHSSERPLVSSSNTNSHSATNNNNHLSSSTSNNQISVSAAKCIVLQVFPRFNCGLPRGTSVRVVINPKATCKDVVKLVINELSKVAKAHNPLLNWDSNPDLFKLCVIVGDSLEQSLDQHRPPLSCADYQPSSVKYIVKLKSNAIPDYFSKYSDI